MHALASETYREALSLGWKALLQYLRTWWLLPLIVAVLLATMTGMGELRHLRGLIEVLGLAFPAIFYMVRQHSGRPIAFTPTLIAICLIGIAISTAPTALALVFERIPRVWGLLYAAITLVAFWLSVRLSGALPFFLASHRRTIGESYRLSWTTFHGERWWRLFSVYLTAIAAPAVLLAIFSRNLLWFSNTEPALVLRFGVFVIEVLGYSWACMAMTALALVAPAMRSTMEASLPQTQ